MAVDSVQTYSPCCSSQYDFTCKGGRGVRRANKMKSGLVSAIKKKLVPDESRVQPVLFGIFKGLRFDINLRSQTQLYLGLWERETFDTIRRASRSAEWFVDIGAGQGELCTLFATLRHVRRVVAIEPIEPAVIALRANLDHNSIHLDRVELFRKIRRHKKEC